MWIAPFRGHARGHSSHSAGGSGQPSWKGRFYWLSRLQRRCGGVRHRRGKQVSGPPFRCALSRSRDLAAGNYTTNSVFVLLGNGNGTFQEYGFENAASIGGVRFCPLFPAKITTLASCRHHRSAKKRGAEVQSELQ